MLSDIDECSTGSFVCHQQALCMDTDGSYICTCLSGYTGDGQSCTGKLHSFFCLHQFALTVGINEKDMYMALCP